MTLTLMAFPIIQDKWDGGRMMGVSLSLVMLMKDRKQLR